MKHRIPVIPAILALGHATLLAAQPDSDNDGMPDAWETSQGLAPADPADALLDTDGDGLNALLEYALGGSVGPNDRALQPQMIPVPEGGRTKLETEFTRRQDNESLVVVPETSTNLLDWNSSGLTLTAPPVRTTPGHERTPSRPDLRTAQ